MNSFVTEFNTVAQRKEPDSVDDAMLVAVARSGDSSAFDELSRRHSRRVLHKIYRITNNWRNEDICSHFNRNYRRSNFYEQIRGSSFPDSQ